MTAKAVPADDPGGSGGGEGQASALADQRAAVIKVAETLRSRTDLAAKVIGGVGTAALTAVGLARIGDLFPLPDDGGTRAMAIAAVAGFLLTGAAIAALTVSLWRVNRPFFIQPDLTQCGELTEAEKALIKPQWDEFTRVNNGKSPAEYQTEAMTLEVEANKLEAGWINEFAGPFKEAVKTTLASGDATKLPASIPASPEADLRRRQSDTMKAEIYLLLSRGGLRVLRKRLSGVMSGWSSVGFALLFTVGLLAFALGTDYVSSERKERVEVAKNCAEAAKAGATSLPKICTGNDKAAPAPTPETAVQHEANVIEAIAAGYKACLKDAKSQPAEIAACQAIRAFFPQP